MNQPWDLSREPIRVKDLEKNGVYPQGQLLDKTPISLRCGVLNLDLLAMWGQLCEPNQQRTSTHLIDVPFPEKEPAPGISHGDGLSLTFSIAITLQAIKCRY